MDLRRSFQSGGQFLATSHNPEFMSQFSRENTFLLARRGHLGPTLVKPLNGVQIKGEGLIPDDLKDRVFVLGILSQPEKLKDDKGLTFEQIGRELEEDCPRQPDGIWNHELLKHNALEVDRMWKALGGILFPSKS
jgi:hypothetical protein